MPPNDKPDGSSRWLENYQQKDQQAREQKQEQRRRVILYTIGILVGAPLLVFLFCCGILTFQGIRKGPDTTKGPPTTP